MFDHPRSAAGIRQPAEQSQVLFHRGNPAERGHRAEQRDPLDHYVPSLMKFQGTFMALLGTDYGDSQTNRNKYTLLLHPAAVARASIGSQLPAVLQPHLGKSNSPSPLTLPPSLLGEKQTSRAGNQSRCPTLIGGTETYLT